MKRIKTLKLNYEFKNVFKKGKYYIGKQIILYTLKNKYGYNRIGIAVSTKTCCAVKRNQIKRLVRAAYQLVVKENNIAIGYDFVFVWNKKANLEELSYNIILEDIEKTFERASVLTEKKGN